MYKQGLVEDVHFKQKLLLGLGFMCPKKSLNILLKIWCTKIGQICSKICTSKLIIENQVEIEYNLISKKKKTNETKLT